jgi:hypothetical protein
MSCFIPAAEVKRLAVFQRKLVHAPRAHLIGSENGVTESQEAVFEVWADDGFGASTG